VVREGSSQPWVEYPLQPTAVVLLEEVPHDVPTCSLIGIDPDKLRAWRRRERRPPSEDAGC
jgi:hypothetical protein